MELLNRTHVKTWILYIAARIVQLAVGSLLHYTISDNYKIPTEVPPFYTKVLVMWPFLVFAIVLILLKTAELIDRTIFKNKTFIFSLLRIVTAIGIAYLIFYFLIVPINQKIAPYRISGHFLSYTTIGGCLIEILCFVSHFDAKLQEHQKQRYIIGFLIFSVLILPHVLCVDTCLLYTSPSPRDRQKSRMPSSA
eukprot:TRINITY_DN9324_c0_g1_i1.p1 TRINITY_DN9324_c0_g1~~TRINITY_DN9324_c0_g1_i1.p1  ORF type:complete len:194 (-),score=8.29 TRINITY_DN9324_c0_g1_i1:10-591(-)